MLVFGGVVGWKTCKQEKMFFSKVQTPGTRKPSIFLMDGSGETAIFHVLIWSHPSETTMLSEYFGYQAYLE